jgi:hypothetical protein
VYVLFLLVLSLTCLILKTYLTQCYLELNSVNYKNLVLVSDGIVHFLCLSEEIEEAQVTCAVCLKCLLAKYYYKHSAESLASNIAATENILTIDFLPGSLSYI